MTDEAAAGEKKPFYVRIPISDGTDGRVGHLFLTELPDGSWRLTHKERSEHEAKTGTDRTEAVEAVAAQLEEFGNARIKIFEQMQKILPTVPEHRAGFRGNYREKVRSLENVRFNRMKNSLRDTGLKLGEHLALHGWPIPKERVLVDGTVLKFG